MTASTEPQASPLRRLIGPEIVRAKVTVTSWEEAVESVGALLVKAGKAEAGYTEAMKRVLKEMGPYAVIAPGIVLLHARPEDGVLEPCLGLITLATAVPFGHSENDPVDLVFALGAVDKEAHISSLKVLAEMLGDQDTLRKIRSAMTDGDLAGIFTGKP